ncbi:hypothetical protein ACTFIZ_008603 [Dictyostelium cf. discoideum]
MRAQPYIHTDWATRAARLKKLASMITVNRSEIATARCAILPQPLGLIGVVVPWNYPLYLLIGPLVAAFVAGNIAMAKLSEAAPQFSKLMAQLVPQYFSSAELIIVEGDENIAKAFVALPFDHLLFTGSTAVGKHVMRAASDNLTPVTLELVVAKHYRHLKDYSSVINAAHYQRLLNLLNEAHDLGAVIFQLTIANQTEITFSKPIDMSANNIKQMNLASMNYDSTSGQLPFFIVTQTTENMRLMQEEIFGSILPIVTYQNVTQAITYIRKRPRPLAFYLFEPHLAEVEKILPQVIAGGVSVNETLLHIAQNNLPFGGVGASGMGAYHGEEGFRTFSKMMLIFYQAKLNTIKWLMPPFNK